MYSKLGLLSVLALLVSASWVAAQPVVAEGGVVNAASYTAAGLPNAAIAQGSMFLVFGSGMGPAALQQVKSFPIPASFAGTSAKVTVNGITVDALIVYTSASQMAAILPSNTPVGTGSITVTYNGVTSAPQTIQVAASNFGIFSINQAGSGPGVLTDANYRVYGLTAAARPGDAGIIWGTGLGAVPFPDSGQPQVKDLTNIPVELFVGGRPAAIAYRGRSSCCSALDQIVFTVPQGVEGCYTSVVLKIGNIVSNTVTMPLTTAENRVCSDPFGFSGSELVTLFGKPNFSLGAITLSRNIMDMTLPAPLPSIHSRTDYGSGSFARYTPALYNASEGLLQSPSVGSCLVLGIRGGNEATDPIQPEWLNAGPFISVNGPMGAKQVPRKDNLYSATLGGGNPPAVLPMYLEPGAYTLDNGAGASGANGIGPFSVGLNIPPQFTWLNMADITTVNRGSGVTLTWSGGDPNGYAVISGTSISSSNAVGAGFVCLERVSAHSFTVPPQVLLALPPSDLDSPMPVGFLNLASGTLPVRFTAPGLDAGVANSSVSSGKTVSYR